MAKYLFIVESPNKAHTIQPFLGKDFIITASAGHIIDLPEKKINVDIKNDFKPTYEIMEDKKDIVKEIIDFSKKADMVYIATDADDAGAGIAYHISSIIPKNIKRKRVKYNEITKQVILDAIKNATSIDDEKDIFDAYETRRIIDRIAGYKVSFPVKQATGGPSAGRVQSAGLRIISELEKEIKAFVPVIYWPIEAELINSKNEKIIATIKTPKPLDIKTEKQAKDIIEVLKKGPLKVSKFEKNNANVNPYPPFTTSTLLQAASSYLGFSVDKTTKASQTIFEKSFITYIRSDSVSMASEAITDIRGDIMKKYGSIYLPKSPVAYANKAKGVQGAHECIRPTDITLLKPSGLAPDEQKLYEMIWKRAVASQMVPASYLRLSAEFSCDKYVLSATGSKELFDGFRKVWTYSDSNDRHLPEMKVGELCKIIDIKTEKKETSPPSRYSEASFIRELEKRGIGRPSTYKTIVKTLQDRKYVGKIGKSLCATELGIKVSDYMIASDVCFINIGFTADMETKLDDISEGKIKKLDVLNEFWDRLKKDLDKMASTKKELQLTTFPCPLCKKNKVEAFLVKKHSKYGEFYSCQNYSDKKIKCSYTANVGDDGTPIEKVKKEVEESKIKCSSCGEKLLVKTSKKGNAYLSCRNWKNKSCAGFYDLSGTKMDFSKKKSWGGKKKWGKNKSQGDDE